MSFGGFHSAGKVAGFLAKRHCAVLDEINILFHHFNDTLVSLQLQWYQ
jgi:hypothetical protein